MSNHVTDEIEIVINYNEIQSTNSFIILPNTNFSSTNLGAGDFIDLINNYKDTQIINNKRIVLEQQLGNYITIFNRVNSFILGRSAQNLEESEVFNVMFNQISKDNKKDFYHYAKNLKNKKYALEPITTNNKLEGSDSILDSVINENYPLVSRKYLYLVPGEDVIDITTTEFDEIKKQRTLLYLGLNTNDTIKFNLNNTVIEITQTSEQSYA